jgi:uncharacterized protein (TIGR00251 family)
VLALTVHAGGVTFAVHVTPRARRPLVGGLHGDALRVAVREPPADGRANAAVLDALAEALGVPRAAVRLDPASRHRRKRVEVAGDGAELAARLRALAGAGRLG